MGVGVSVGGKGVGLGRVGIRVNVGVGVEGTAVGGCSNSLVGVGVGGRSSDCDGTMANLNTVKSDNSASMSISALRARFSLAPANSFSKEKIVSALLLLALRSSYRVRRSARNPTA